MLPYDGCPDRAGRSAARRSEHNYASPCSPPRACRIASPAVRHTSDASTAPANSIFLPGFMGAWYFDRGYMSLAIVRFRRMPVWQILLIDSLPLVFLFVLVRWTVRAQRDARSIVAKGGPGSSAFRGAVGVRGRQRPERLFQRGLSSSGKPADVVPDRTRASTCAGR